MGINAQTKLNPGDLTEKMDREDDRFGRHAIHEEALHIVLHDSESEHGKRRLLQNFAMAYGFAAYLNSAPSVAVFKKPDGDYEP